MYMDGRYEEMNIKKRGWFRQFILSCYLTFLAPLLFIIAKAIMAVGESITTPTLLFTFNRKRANQVRNFFDKMCQYVLDDIDAY
jgi:hypothetical protein